MQNIEQASLFMIYRGNVWATSGSRALVPPQSYDLEGTNEFSPIDTHRLTCLQNRLSVRHLEIVTPLIVS